MIAYSPSSPVLQKLRAAASAVFSPSAFRPASRVPSLDGLRALSIMLVLLSHAQGTRGFLVRSAFQYWGDLGHLGVRVFFVISGFLITGLLLREVETTGSISLKGFYLRRFFRIFPAYYAYIAVIALCAYWHRVVLSKDDLLYALTYTMNYHSARSWLVGHAWSLSVEEQFYLLWPAVVAFGRRRGALRVAAVAVLLAPILKMSTYYFLPSWRPTMGESFQTVADTLAVGCLLAIGRDWLKQRGWYVRMLGSKFMLCVPDHPDHELAASARPLQLAMR
jgi:peptidoglycan/LPS O-acetylase OafA/YrhL